MIRDAPPIRALGVALREPGWAILLDPADPADAAEFALWYLKQLPSLHPPVLLSSVGPPAITATLGPRTTAEDLLSVLAPLDVARPAAAAVGALAAAIHDGVSASVWWRQVCAIVRANPHRRVTLAGAMLVASLDPRADTEPLLREAARILALRAAVHRLTGSDTTAATLIASPPVDDAVRAVLAEHTLCRNLTEATGIRLVAQTTAWTPLGWQADNYTHHCYRSAWGEPDRRFWLDAAEVRRRLTALARLYADIGIHAHTGGHRIRFERHPDPSMVAI